MPKCPPTGGVRLQEVSVSGGSTVIQLTFSQAEKVSVTRAGNLFIYLIFT